MPGQLINFTVFRTPPEELLVLVASLYVRGRAGTAADYQWWSGRHYLKRGLFGDCTYTGCGLSTI